MSHYFTFALFGILVSAGLMPFLIALAQRIGIVDHPTHRKIHSTPIPYMGGIGIIAAFTLVPAVYFHFFKTLLSPGDAARFAAIVLPAIAAGVLGLIDDARQVRPRFKLIVQVAIAVCFAYFGYRIEVIKIPGLGSYELFAIESFPVTVLWTLVVINGVNLVDGIDGLAGTATATIFAGIAVLALTLQVPDYLIAAIALSAFGGAIGFLFFNWRPAKIYMGDAGSLASGMLIAGMLIALGQRQPVGTSNVLDGGIAEPYSDQFVKITLMAFYPVKEISLSVLRRLLSGKPIGSADKGHIHHRLLRWGWTAPMVCAAAALVGALAASTVVLAQFHYRGLAVWPLMALGVQFALMLHFCGYLEMIDPRAVRGNRKYFLIANHFMSMQRIKLELAHDVGEIDALVAQTCIEFGVKTYAITIPRQGTPEQPLELRWSKPDYAHSSLLLTPDSPNASGVIAAFSDKVDFDGGAQAIWTFEPHDVEDEIDVEYRVLMSEFMRKALGCAEFLCRARLPDSTPSREAAQGATGVSSSMLRRRQQTNSTRVPGNMPRDKPAPPGEKSTKPK